MSFGWGIFFCIFYTPIGGAIAISFSGRYGYSVKAKNKETTKYYIKLLLCIIIGLWSLLGGYFKYDRWRYEPAFYWETEDAIRFILLGIGLLGNAIYLLSNADMDVYEPPITETPPNE
jgi:hypothetical protein